MILVDDDELPHLRAEEHVGVLETPLIDRPLQIEVDRVLRPIGRDLPRQRGLAYLTRSRQDDTGM